ncbi:hypothetical protein F4824DRAFT_490725 [Ustulina deusta]|nr:hypothetical protein F4824DRAFT_490725 [Ustulina deusta]
MDDKIQQLRRQLAEEQRRRDLEQYLESCHLLSLAINVVTDRSLTTQGETTNPTGRVFPRKIIPWDAFPTKQQEIWDQLSTSLQFSSERSFPSQHQMEYVMSLIEPMSREVRLRAFTRDTVKNAVKKLVDDVNTDPILRRNLGLQGNVTFESHTNLENTQVDVSKSLEQLSVDDEDRESVTATSKRADRQSRRKNKGKGNLADQFCIYRTADGRNMPTLAIEYKAPHKLTRGAAIGKEPRN